jgi:hypothetical protein
LSFLQIHKSQQKGNILANKNNNNKLPIENKNNNNNNNIYGNLIHLQQALGNQAVQRTIKSNQIQAKLRVSQPGDPYEIEADRVANIVMRMSSNDFDIANVTPNGISGDNKEVNRKCSRCEQEDNYNKPIQISKKSNITSNNSDVSNLITNNINNVINYGGKPLDTSIQDFMESKFEYDFSNVKTHHDDKASKSAQQINALAYTVGNHIVFSKDQYSPSTTKGMSLIAHELTHVIQQSGENLQAQRQSLNPDPTTIQDELLEPLDSALKKAIEDSEQDNDLQLRAYSTRYLVLLERKANNPDFVSKQEITNFINECLNLATTEKETESVFDPAKFEVILVSYPKGFPDEWSKRVRKVLSFDIDSMNEIHNKSDEASKNLEKLSKDLVLQIYEDGLPVPITEIGRLDSRFRLKRDDSEKSYVYAHVQNFAIQAQDYMKLKGQSQFYLSWQGSVNVFTSQVAAGEYVINDVDWKSLDKNKLGQLQDVKNLPEDISQPMLPNQPSQQIQQTATGQPNLWDLVMLMRFFSGLNYLKGRSDAWEKASQLFDTSLYSADQMIASSSGPYCFVIAIKWAIKHGYFGANILAYLDDLIQSIPEIIGQIAILFGVQFVPGLNIVVDVLLALQVGLDGIEILVNLIDCIHDVMSAKSVTQLQKDSARLAKIITNGGMEIIQDVLLKRSLKAAGKIKGAVTKPQAPKPTPAAPTPTPAAPTPTPAAPTPKPVEPKKQPEPEPAPKKQPEPEPAPKKQPEPEPAPKKQPEPEPAPKKQPEPKTKTGEEPPAVNVRPVSKADPFVGVKSLIEHYTKTREPLIKESKNLSDQIEKYQPKLNELDAQIKSIQKQIDEAPIGKKSPLRAKESELRREREPLAKQVNELYGQLKNVGNQIQNLTSHIGRLKNALKEGTYTRPKFTKEERDKVWEKAREEAKDGIVRDPLPPHKPIEKDGDWEMGHKPKFEFWKHQLMAAKRGLSREQWKTECENLGLYRPETRQTNSSHKAEAPDHEYEGYGKDSWNK